MITLEQAKNLALGDTLYHNTARNADGSHVRWRVNGAAKLWKTRPNDIRIPLKHGLYSYSALTPRHFSEFSLTEEEALP